MSKVLFVINGASLGNSTRCHAIMSELKKFGVDIVVATGGAGERYFLGRTEVSRLYPLKCEGYRSDRSGLNLGSVISSIFAFFKNGAWNGIALYKILRKERPDVIVYDSVYNLAPLAFTRTPLFSLNNSDKIARNFFKTKEKPFSIYAHFAIVEAFDFLYQHVFPNRVISPWFQADASCEGKFVHIPLICRSDALTSAGNESREKPIVAVLHSGSSLGEDFGRHLSSLNAEVLIIGRNGRSEKNIRYLGHQRDSLSILKKADCFVVTGGFSSLSECLALKKPVFVIPIAGHAEQFVNAATVESLGLARKTDLANIAHDLEKALQHLEKAGTSEADTPAVRFSGAHLAAREIFNELSRSMGKFQRK